MSMTTFPLTDAQIEALARRRAGARLGWIIHASVFVGVNLLHVALALWHGRVPAVHGFGMAAWAFALAMHGLWVFVLGNGSALADRLVARERARLQSRRDPW